MEKAFKHPLARKAIIAKARRRNGSEENLLVVLTTLELDAHAKGFSKKNFDRLSEAAKEHLAEVKEIASYTIINRPKEWG